MTLASDENKSPGTLSALATRMLDLRDAVLMEWEERLRSRVNEAASLPHAVLINTFPTMYQSLAEALSPAFPRPPAEDNSTTAAEHGGERARLTHYNLQALISEYQLLRWTILDVLKRNGVAMSREELLVIHGYIDSAIQQAVNAFALAQAALRERFVATLSHDLRNPMQVIAGAAELIQHLHDVDKIHELASRIADNNQRMDGMIQDLLDSAIFQSGERLRLLLSAFDMLDLAQEVCLQQQAIHGERFEVAGTPVQGWWGREEVKRALENLIGNAIRYGAADSRVRIGLRTQHDRVTLTVHNHGDPIPPEQIENLFQVFRRAEELKHGGAMGLGIGLPYVRSVAESHGGSVGIDSSAERGTTISIDMPLDARPFQHSPTLG